MAAQIVGARGTGSTARQYLQYRALIVQLASVYIRLIVKTTVRMVISETLACPIPVCMQAHASPMQQARPCTRMQAPGHSVRLTSGDFLVDW